MTYQEIIKSLKNKAYKPIYFLHGKEPYYIDAVTNYIEANVLTEGEKAFNQTTLYGKDTDYLKVLDIARRYPMMAERQVVIIKEAQEMKSLPSLITYAEKPLDSTLLVICYKYKKFDGRTKFAKAIKKHLIFESKKLYDNQVPKWIEDYVQTKKLSITPNASELIAEYLGTDLSHIGNELDKLAINLPAGETITDKEVQDQIGISKDYNVFELQKALSQRDLLKANRIVNYFVANPKKNPLVLVIGSLSNFFAKAYMSCFVASRSDAELATTLGITFRNEYSASFKVNDYKTARKTYGQNRIENIIGLLRDYDLRSKGVNNSSTESGALLREMVYKIMH